MIDPETEHIYNIILSIFLGIILAITINQIMSQPRTPIIYVK